MTVFQWVVFLIHVIFFNVGWVFGCRRYLKTQGGFTYNSASVALLLTVTTVIFLMSDVNKLHLLWITPLISFVLPVIDLFSIPIFGKIYLMIVILFSRIITVGVRPNKSVDVEDHILDMMAHNPEFKDKVLDDIIRGNKEIKS